MGKISWKSRIHGLFVFFLVFLLVACSSTSPSGGNQAAPQTPDTGGSTSNDTKQENVSPLTYEGADREQKLMEGAKKEGKLTWYTSLAGNVVNALVQEFEKTYPFIKVEVFRGDQANVVQRITQESQASKNMVDVVEVTSDGALLLREMGMLSPYFSPSALKLPQAYRTKADGNTLWEASDRVSYIGFSYNKEKLPASAIPKTLNDLLKPELKDKLTIVSSTTGVRWVGAVLNGLGDQEGHKFLSELKKQNVKVQSVSGAALMELIGQGEVSASMSIFQNHTEQQQQKGAKVEWIPVEPVIANAGDVVIAKQPVNPNSAMLFADFILGDKGKEVFKKAQYSTASDQVSFKYWLPEEGLESSKQYQQLYKEWKELFESTFR